MSFFFPIFSNQRSRFSLNIIRYLLKSLNNIMILDVKKQAYIA